MCKLADLANAEFLSSRVPKQDMLRTNGEPSTMKKRNIQQIKQMSTIIGSTAPKPHLGRNYPNKHSNHAVKSCQTFIKAMVMLAKESEELIKQIIPTQYEKQLELFADTLDKWKIGKLFTSSISNFNISAAFHKDGLNMQGAVNVIICKKIKFTRRRLTRS